MSLVIRSFTEQDYDALAAVRNAVYDDDPSTADEIRRHDEQRDPKCKFARQLAMWGEEVVGVGSYNQSPWAYHPRKFAMNIHVHPDYRNRGIGSALYEQVWGALQVYQPLEVKAFVREKHPESMQFVEKRGYGEIERMWESELDLHAFDPAPYVGLEERLKAQGIILQSLAEMMLDPILMRQVYEANTALMKDVPWEGEHTAPEYKRWVKQFFENPRFLPETCVNAMYKGRIVGMTSLWKMNVPGRLDTGLTAVERAYRGKGIATALKVRSLLAGKAQGYEKVRTENHTHNDSMLGINERLGFARQPAIIIYGKTMEE
jgi:mycothiol synthase